VIGDGEEQKEEEGISIKPEGEVVNSQNDDKVDDE
jgi:hypothetical protein